MSNAELRQMDQNNILHATRRRVVKQPINRYDGVTDNTGKDQNNQAVILFKDVSTLAFKKTGSQTAILLFSIGWTVCNTPLLSLFIVLVRKQKEQAMKTLISIIFMSASLAATSAENNKELSLETWLSFIKISAQMQCKKYESHYEKISLNGKEEDIKLAKSSMSLACECIPNEITSFLAQSTDKSDAVTEADFRVLFAPNLNRCAAKEMRANLAYACVKDTSIVQADTDRKSYCNCYSHKVGALDDATLAESAAQANRDFKARVNALRDGKPTPEKTRTVLDEISESCKAIQTNDAE